MPKKINKQEYGLERSTISTTFGFGGHVSWFINPAFKIVLVFVEVHLIIIHGKIYWVKTLYEFPIEFSNYMYIRLYQPIYIKTVLLKWSIIHAKIRSHWHCDIREKELEFPTRSNDKCLAVFSIDIKIMLMQRNIQPPSMPKFYVIGTWVWVISEKDFP